MGGCSNMAVLLLCFGQYSQSIDLTRYYPNLDCRRLESSKDLLETAEMRYAPLSLLFAATITMLTPATAQQSLSCWPGDDDKRAASSDNGCNWQHGSTVG